MALARCDDHKPDVVGDDYESYALPIGYPTASVTCDVVGCAWPARMWLTADERAAFASGARTFVIAGGASVPVSDDLFPN